MESSCTMTQEWGTSPVKGACFIIKAKDDEPEETELWIRHVKVDNANPVVMSICGINIAFVFHFTSIDHLFLAKRNGDPRECCPECLKIIIETIKER